MTTNTTKLLSGYDLIYRIDSVFSSGQYIDVIANISITEWGADSCIRVINDGGCYVMMLYGVVLVEKFYVGPTMPNVVEIVYYHEYISISFDGVGVHNFYPENVIYYTDDSLVSIESSHAITLTNVRLKELYDWREAIYADLESTSQAAIGSVIQQRPVEIFGSSDGTIRYQYFPSVRQEKELSEFVMNHSVNRSPSNQLCSEGIVYFTNTGIKLDEVAFANYGFITRSFRLPDLDSGAMKATGVMQLRARESVEQHDILCRFDPSIEVGDKIIDTFSLPGSSTPVTMEVIVEAISISLAQGRFMMKIKGRGNGES